MHTKKFLRLGLLTTLLVGMAISAEAQKQKPSVPTMAVGKNTVRRASLAKSASFTVTTVLAPQGGSKVSQVFKVEISGSNGRVDYSDANFGTVRYLANAKGVFQYIEGSEAAVKLNVKGGIDEGLKLVFSQSGNYLKNAKKIGTATVSGQPTDIYQSVDPKTKSEALVYLGKKPGFQLPVKTVLRNEGGVRTLLVSDIKTGVALSSSRFALPPGAKIIESERGVASLPGGGG